MTGFDHVDGVSDNLSRLALTMRPKVAGGNIVVTQTARGLGGGYGDNGLGGDEFRTMARRNNFSGINGTIATHDLIAFFQDDLVQAQRVTNGPA